MFDILYVIDGVIESVHNIIVYVWRKFLLNINYNIIFIF